MKPEQWRHVVGRFHGLVDRLRLPAEDHRKALATADRLTHAVGDRLTGQAATRAVSRVVIGGCAKGTAIAGPATVDCLLVLPEPWRHVGGHRLASEIVAALGDDGIRAGIAPFVWNAVVAADGPTRLRLVPAFVLAAGGYMVADARGDWRHCHPDEERTRLHRMNRGSRDKATHLILMAKAWRSACGVPLSPFAIELLANEFLTVWNYPRRSLYFYDWMVRDFFFWICHQSNRPLAIPGTFETLLLDDSWVPAAVTAQRLADEACRLERDNRSDEALDRWRRVFGRWIDGREAAAALPATDAASATGSPDRQTAA